MKISAIPIRLLPLLVPFASWWVRERERRALARGVGLSEPQMADAISAGVLSPDRVRLLTVRRIPVFEHRLLQPFAFLLRGVFATTAGLTAGHGILVCEAWRNDRRLMVHELAHVAQYERFGGIRPFLRTYLRECLLYGYPFGSLEQEASRIAAQVTAEAP